MIACIFCGSGNIRRSGSSTLDATVKRIVRALTFRCLYRCRSCDALFEAILLGGKRNGRKARPQQKGQRRNAVSFDSRVKPLKTAEN
jgi:hypothetical protein